jgi:hypothetical protein
LTQFKAFISKFGVKISILFKKKPERRTKKPERRTKKPALRIKKPERRTKEPERRTKKPDAFVYEYEYIVS